MGLDIGKSFTPGGLLKGGIVGNLLGNMFSTPKPLPTPQISDTAVQTRDANTQATMASMLARGLSPGGVSGPAGDLTAANIGKKSLLGS